MERFIPYINTRKETKIHAQKSVSGSEEHVQMVCSKTQGLKAFLRDSVLSKHHDAEAANIALGSYSVGDFRHLFNELTPKNHKTEICFTAFKKIGKERLKENSISSAMSVRSSITKNLHILFWGYNT